MFHQDPPEMNLSDAESDMDASFTEEVDQDKIVTNEPEEPGPYITVIQEEDLDLSLLNFSSIGHTPADSPPSLAPQKTAVSSQSIHLILPSGISVVTEDYFKEQLKSVPRFLQSHVALNPKSSYTSGRTIFETLRGENEVAIQKTPLASSQALTKP